MQPRDTWLFNQCFKFVAPMYVQTFSFLKMFLPVSVVNTLQAFGTIINIIIIIPQALLTVKVVSAVVQFVCWQNGAASVD